MTELEKSIGFEFKNKDLLDTALTHSSFANEAKHKMNSNERLEFLGDAVLNIIVSKYIFKKYPDSPEGVLTKFRSSLVCEQSLCNFSRQINIGKYLKLSRGEKKSQGEKRPSILADAFEALLAAIYLDAGMPDAEKFVLKFILPQINDPDNTSFKDYKTVLQELIQKNPEDQLKYNLVRESGPDHNKRFLVEVQLNSKPIAQGEGRSKKEAEQYAAKKALNRMGYN